MPSSEQHAQNLRAARSASVPSAKNIKSSIQNAKKNLKAAVNAGALMAHIDPFMDWLFGIALIFAIIKDVLDYVDTALDAIGGVGEILIIITTLICSMAIGFIMLLTGSNGKTKMARTIIRRFLILVGGTIIEFIPGVDLLPIESLVVIVVVWMTLVERKRAAEENARIQPEMEMA